MAVDTPIQWTDHTDNPWRGCIPVSEGCKNCYAAREYNRYDPDGTGNLGKFKNIQKTKSFGQPLKWKKKVGTDPKFFPGMKIFVCSWSDFFVEQADKWRNDYWDIIRQCPEFIFQILTKRPERIMDHLPHDWGDGWDNVWIGTSVENQKRANERIPILGAVPAKLKFISFEPLIWDINLMSEELRYHMWDVHYSTIDGQTFKDPVFENNADIGWAIIGGESGNERGKFSYRACKLEWIKDLKEQLEEMEIPVFIKQLGTQNYHELKGEGITDRHGGDLENLPTHLKFLNLREMPEHNVNTEQPNLFNQRKL